MKKILVILANPDSNSFSIALCERYAEGARKAGHEVKMLKLGELQFDPVLRSGYKQRQELEPDLMAAWDHIQWAQHLVWVFPTWWGQLPALLKGFFDRLFLPGMAFKYRLNSQWWDKYLTGRSARIITTMDSPGFYNRLVYGNANIRGLKNATLEFCGIKPVRVTIFDRLRFSDEKKRAKMLNTVERLGGKGV